MAFMLNMILELVNEHQSPVASDPQSRRRMTEDHYFSIRELACFRFRRQFGTAASRELSVGVVIINGLLDDWPWTKRRPRQLGPTSDA